MKRPSHLRRQLLSGSRRTSASKYDDVTDGWGRGDSAASFALEALLAKSTLAKAFRMPVPVKITGRTSSITNSFVNGVIPAIMPSDGEIALALGVLGMDASDVRCAYCGDPATEWDHLNAIVRDKRPTGYISEIHNLVPACGKCNQSKGNKPWREWMFGPSPLSPASRGVGDVVERDDAPEGRELEVAPDRHVPGVPVLLDEPAGVRGPAQPAEAPLGMVGVHAVERVRCKAQQGG